VLVENVPDLLARGMAELLGDLSDLGYDAEWSIVSAASVGAPHLRERLFLVAYPEGDSLGAGLRTYPPQKIRWRRPRNFSRPGDIWATEPDVGRVADGIPARLDRLAALGDAVVPQVAETLGKWLLEARP
jgi:DNA (cytosine-5)-methyltransferase 1